MFQLTKSYQNKKNKQSLTPADTLLSQETNLYNLLSISRTFISPIPRLTVQSAKGAERK